MSYGSLYTNLSYRIMFLAGGGRQRLFAITMWLHGIGKHEWSLVWGELGKECCGDAPRMDARAGVSLLIC